MDKEQKSIKLLQQIIKLNDFAYAFVIAGTKYGQNHVIKDSNPKTSNYGIFVSLLLHNLKLSLLNTKHNMSDLSPRSLNNIDYLLNALDNFIMEDMLVKREDEARENNN